jgi:hypothetical protein
MDNEIAGVQVGQSYVFQSYTIVIAEIDHCIMTAICGLKQRLLLSVLRFSKHRLQVGDVLD